MGFEFIEGFVCALAVMGAIGFVVGMVVLWSPFDRLPQLPPAPPPYPNPYIKEAQMSAQANVYGVGRPLSNPDWR